MLIVMAIVISMVMIQMMAILTMTSPAMPMIKITACWIQARVVLGI